MDKLSETLMRWDSKKPLSPDDLVKLNRKITLDFNFNSNHIEGNTLTYGQTEILLLTGQVIGTAKMRDLEEMKAHNVCLNMVRQEASEGRPLTENFIRQIHKVMLREDYEVHRQLPGGKTTSYTVHAGRYKTRPNSVITPSGERFEYASPEETPALMTDLLDWYRDADASGWYTPIELAALFHYRYIRIHPFEDGNGRISRLMVNFILLSHDWPMLVVKTANKDKYLAALRLVDNITGPIPSEGSHASMEQAKAFVDYLTGVFIDDVTSMIDFLEGDNDKTCWFQGRVVHFRSHNSIKILRLLTTEPNATVDRLADVTGISRTSIQKQLKGLAEKGYIIRPEGKKRGWIVIARCS